MNFKVSFYLRSNYENKEGKSPVMLRIFLGGEMANFGTTKIFVKKSLWSNATSRLRGRTAEALSVNAALDSISTTLHGIYRKYENDESLSLDLIRTVYFGKNREFTSFLPVFDKFLEDIKQRVTKGGANIIKLRGRSSFQSPAYVSIEMIRAAMGGAPFRWPAGCYVNIPGLDHVVMGMETVIDKDGVHYSHEIKGSEEEKAALKKSYEHLVKMRDEVISMGVIPAVADWKTVNPNL